MLVNVTVKGQYFLQCLKVSSCSVQVQPGEGLISVDRTRSGGLLG